MKWSTCLQVWVNLSLLLIHKYSDFKFELFGAIKSILAVKECSAQAWRQPVTLDYNLIKQPRPSVVRLLSSPTPALLFYLSLFLKNNYSHSSWQRNTHPPGSCRVAAGREGGRKGGRGREHLGGSSFLKCCRLVYVWQEHTFWTAKPAYFFSARQRSALGYFTWKDGICVIEIWWGEVKVNWDRNQERN